MRKLRDAEREIGHLFDGKFSIFQELKQRLRLGGTCRTVLQRRQVERRSTLPPRDATALDRACKKHTATVIRGACKSFVKTFEVQTLLELADKLEKEAGEWALSS